LTNSSSKRIINFRAFLIVASLIIAFVLSLCTIFVNTYFGIFLLVLLLSVQSVAVFVYKTKDNKKFFVFLLSLVCSFILIVVFFVKIANWTNGIEQGVHNFDGTVDKVVFNDDRNFATITLTGHSIDGRVKNGKLMLFVTFEEESQRILIEQGYNVSGKGFIQQVPIFGDNGLNVGKFIDNVRYTSNLSSKNIQTTQQSLKGIRWLRQKITKFIISNLSPTNAGIAIGMLLGDTTHLNDSTTNIFAMSGIVHVLAVSGLHLSILSTFIAFFIRRLKRSQIFGFILTTLILLGFSYLADWSVGVVRAFIMATVAGIAKLTGKRYDQLSSLSIAVIITLLINPFMLFGTGFALSFGAVLSIFLFANPIKKILSKIHIKNKHIPKKIVDAFSIAASVQILTVLLTAWLLGQFPTYALLSNILLAPFITILFVISLGTTFISFIFPFFGYVLQFFDILFNLFLYIAGWIAGLPYALVYLDPNILLVFLSIGVLILTSRFCLAKRNNKFVIPFVAVIYCITIVSGFSKLDIKNTVIPLSNNNSIIITEKVNIAFAYSSNASSFVRELHSRRIYNIDYMFLTYDIFSIVSDYDYFERVFGIKEFVLPYTMDSDFVIELNKTQNVDILDDHDIKHIGGFDISMQTLQGVFLGYKLQGDVNILVTAKNIKPSLWSQEQLDNCDIVRSSSNFSYNGAIQIVDYAYSGFNEFVIVANISDGVYLDYKDYKIGHIVLRDTQV